MTFKIQEFWDVLSRDANYKHQKTFGCIEEELRFHVTETMLDHKADYKVFQKP